MNLPVASCLICGQKRELSVWVDPALVHGDPQGVCFSCRDAASAPKRLKEKVIQELGFGMGVPGEVDVAFVAVWLSQRQNGHLSPTFCAMYNEPVNVETKQKISEILRSYADRITEDDPPRAN